jgi:dipeptidyl aminopeptidase/acylaminoacyl peptidase
VSRDLQTQLAEYGAQVRSDLPELDPHEVMFGGESSVVVGGWSNRRTPQRRGVVVVVAAFLAVVSIGLFQLLASRPPEVADTDPVAPPLSDLGVFEPMRGWIIYPTGGDLEAVNPDNPSERTKLDLPLEDGWLVPVGWSADGSLLALDNEDAGSWSVMGPSGEIRLAGSSGGCCLFVGSNWLSPDGTSKLRSALGGTALAIDNHSAADAPRFVDLSQVEGFTGLRDAIWSPDGTEIAVVVQKEAGIRIVVVDVDTGSFRELDDSALGYVRHLAWSPDGTQILVTSADLDVGEREEYPAVNPLVNPIAAHLNLVSVDGSDPREIASGHYVVAVWSPDGNRIAALDYTSEGRRVVLMHADGSGQTVLPDVVPSGPFTGIAWHPAP